MSIVSRIVVEVEGSDWVNKVTYDPETGRSEIVTIKTPTNPIVHQIPADIFYALQFNMADFHDKDGNESAGAAVSDFIRRHTDYSVKATSTWADELVEGLTDAQKDALVASLIL